MGRHLAERLRALPLNRKVKLYLILGITVISGGLLSVSAAASISLLANRSRDLTRANMETMAEGMDVLAGNFKSMMQSLIPNTAIQGYLKTEKGEGDYGRLTVESRYILSISSALREGINFVGLYKNTDEYIYRGVAINKSNYSTRYTEDYRQSVPWGSGDLRIHYGDTYFVPGHYTLTFYQPVYDMDRIGRQIGMLCVNVEEDVLELLREKTVGNSWLQSSLVQGDGTILFAADKSLIGTKTGWEFSEKKGMAVQGKYLLAYQKIGGSSLYVVGQIDNREVLRYNLFALSFLFVTVVAIVAIGLYLASWGVRKTYAPMEELVGYMHQVSDGNLDVRIHGFAYGDDLRAISDGFNHMLDSINRLMEQVKEEQRTSVQIRMNALQEQIKPHFLYNALDCIRWQAAASGSREISGLVKALANYYRISLSGGRDVILLREEIACIQNYVVLQNMRYQGVAELRCLPDAQYDSVEIPKLTLQPLIENCIYHGIQDRNSGDSVRIDISVRQDGDSLIIQVADDGVGMGNEKREILNKSLVEQDGQIGYGVRNVYRRLRLLYGEACGLCYREKLTKGALVEIRLPAPDMQPEDGEGNDGVSDFDRG